MVNIQIGNTFLVHWQITTDGEPVSLEGRDIKPILLAPSGKPQRINPRRDNTDASVFSFEFEGTEQKELGVYRIVAVENKGGTPQAITDETMAFRLVATAEEVSADTAYIKLPIVLDGEQVDTVIPTGITVAILGSPMKITHGLDKFPVVVVLMKFGDIYEQVDVLVEYLSRNEVRVSWDKPEDAEGYIHII